MSSLVFLGDLYTHTERPTFAEGLYRYCLSSSAASDCYAFPHTKFKIAGKQCTIGGSEVAIERQKAWAIFLSIADYANSIDLTVLLGALLLAPSQQRAEGAWMNQWQVKQTGKNTKLCFMHRSASKMVYRSPNPPLPLVFSQEPPTVHSSLSCLLAWRYAQLLTVLPKRETEAHFWQKHAEQLLPASFNGKGLEECFGPLTSLKGGGAQADGFFVDNSCRRVLPCASPIVHWSKSVSVSSD